MKITKVRVFEAVGGERSGLALYEIHRGGLEPNEVSSYRLRFTEVESDDGLTGLAIGGSAEVKALGRNLIGKDISGGSVGGMTAALALGFIFENDGPNDTGQFDFEWRVVQMMPDMQYNPRRDVNASDIDPNTDRVMRISTGTVVLINTLPQVSAGYDNSDVWGILERNGFEQSNIETHSGLTPTSSDRFDRTITITGVTVGSNQATSFGMSLIMDPSNALQEINEADNVHTKEEFYFF